MSQKEQYLLGLGAFRLVLAWFVIASHTTGYYESFTTDVGTVAVTTFFFISGFLIPLTFEANYSKYDQTSAAKKFYLNRFIRIYPIYWSTLLFFAVQAFAFPLLKRNKIDISAGSEQPFITWVQNILLIGLNQSVLWGNYIRFNNPAWTLDIELQYYLLVPFLLFFF